MHFLRKANENKAIQDQCEVMFAVWGERVPRLFLMLKDVYILDQQAGLSKGRKVELSCPTILNEVVGHRRKTNQN